MPHSCRLDQGQSASKQTCARIFGAVRDLLMSLDSYSGFSIEALARRLCYRLVRLDRI
jgi:hypothetical protein